MWCNSGLQEEPHETVVLISHTDQEKIDSKRLTAKRGCLLLEMSTDGFFPTHRWRGEKWVTNYYLTTQVKSVNVKEREGGVVETRDRRHHSGIQGCLQRGPEESPACKTERA